MQLYDLFPVELMEAAVPVISPQDAADQHLFGPMYHGTRADLGSIVANGFDPNLSRNGRSNGYPLEAYGGTGIAAPIHHLGFGTYFTTVKAIAKQYAGGTAKGMRTFYLDSRNVEQINFGAANTMMKWWRANGYDMTSADTQTRNARAWIAATERLTETLQSRCDAVHFLGKGIRKLLDGDQVCVYRTDLVRVLNPKLASGLQIGAKVTHTQVVPQRYKNSNVFYVDDLKPNDFGLAGRLAGSGWRGVFRADTEDRPGGRYPIHFIPPPGLVGVLTPRQGGAHNDYHKTPMYSVKWSKGGEMYNYQPEELEPVSR